jgi:hypothetical protein
LVRFRDDDLASARWKLGPMAGAVGAAFNRLQAQGVDAAGARGSPMFSIGAPAVGAATTNTGSAALAAAVTGAAALQASDYTVQFDGTNAHRDPDVGQCQEHDPVGAARLGRHTRRADDLRSRRACRRRATANFMIRSASTQAAGFELALAVAPTRPATGLAAIPQLGAGNGGDLSVQAFGVDASGPATSPQPVSSHLHGQRHLRYLRYRHRQRHRGFVDARPADTSATAAGR